MSEFETNLDAKVVSTMEETDKKCPSCGGVMDFDPATGGLSCPYCGHVEMIEKKPSQPESAQELDFESAESVQNCNWGVEKKTVLCKACGAESVYDALEISAVCPFCGSNQVMEAGDKKTMAPGGVIPFQVTDEKASELFKRWIKKKWFCPKLARESAKAKNFKGVYLPYWTFDAKTTSEYKADYGKERKVRKGEETKTVVDWYPTGGVYKEAFDDELVCATTNHSQSMLNGIEPYNTAANKSYKPEYVAGFAAERYAVGLKEGWEMAKESIHFKLSDNIEKKIRKEEHADRIRNLRMTTKYRDITYKYLLLPVWISSYKYKDKVYQFMVNGQTGKVSGKIPISIPKVIITVAAAIAAAALIMWLSSY
ncbi:MAG: TFIIB-type zinc ribbon-containing protein [Eubacterium sp.]|nr:TFIIB-type zinc ribbon-containing protein [Lachnospiraceae bacterium]MBO5487181.1 TFIIB-type zinc ribbon-containing protein [Eubacterium sp.]